jgi:hypothetical protein
MAMASDSVTPTEEGEREEGALLAGLAFEAEVLVEGAADFLGIETSTRMRGMGGNERVGGVFIQFASHLATAPR